MQKGGGEGREGKDREQKGRERKKKKKKKKKDATNIYVQSLATYFHFF